MAPAAASLRPSRDEQRHAASSLADLFVPLEWLLVSGGDARLAIRAADGLNIYGCSAHPRDAAAFASSTASSISERAYVRAYAARADLVAAAATTGFDEAFDARLEAIREELASLLGMAQADVVLSPSGTDSQLHALFAARAVHGNTLTSIVLAADETGSGTAFTARGRHFGERTALGIAIAKDETIAGLGEGVVSLAIPLKDETGAFRDPDTVDAAVEQAVDTAIAAGRRVVLQAMDRSKFARRAPGQSCLHRIAARHGERVLIVVDACQARLSRTRIADYIGRGFIVLTTGSKFFGGPPFSGAMLVPPRIATALQGARVPPGLADYTAAPEWPRRWTALRAQLPDHKNFGLWLRWEAALTEIRDYFAVPAEARREILSTFADAAAAAIGTCEHLTPLPEQPEDLGDRLDDGELAIRTVFPFTVRRNGAELDTAACTTLYRALNRDVSNLLPAGSGSEDSWLAAQICHIGQPVTISSANGHARAALRINAGARLVSECWSIDASDMRGRVAAQIDRMAVTLRKLGLLLTRFDDIAKGTP